MLCRRCSAMVPAGQPDGGALRVGAVAGVLCARCGTVLGPYDLSARLVAKLAQLSRFGLTGRNELLRPPPPSPKDS